MKVLAFGHLPLRVGGKQSSGLAEALWSIAEGLAQIKSKDIAQYLIATDYHQKQTVINGVNILGYTKKLILVIFLRYPVWIGVHAIIACKLSREYRIPFFNSFIKLTFYRYGLKQVNPDIVHLHGPHNFILFKSLPGKNKYKSIFTSHGVCGVEQNLKQREYMEKIESQIHQEVDFMTFVSADTRNIWNRHYRSNTSNQRVILNGYNNADFYYDGEKRQSTNELRLITIGMLHDLKGQKSVIKAIAESGLQKEVVYTCIGKSDEEYQEEMEALSRKHKVRFKYLGVLTHSEIREQLWQNDFMILPSSSEGFGLVFIESIASGTPVVLPQHLAIVKERILSDENAVLMPDETVTSIKSFILNARNHKFDHSKTARSVQAEGWGEIARQYEEVFRNI